MKKVFLLDLPGGRYAVAASRVRSVREAGGISRLSLGPEYLAGLTVVDGRTTALVDLAVCLGLPPTSGKRPRQVLIPAGSQELPAFLVEGEIRRLPVPAAAGRPLSGCLPLSYLDGALLLEGLPVPLIDLQALLLAIEAGRCIPGAARLTPAGGRQRQLSRLRNFRLLSVGQKPYALPAADLRAGVATSPVVPLGGLPPQVRGIAATPAGVLPVVRLDLLLGETSGEEEALLLAGEAEAPFLLSAFRDHGELPGKALPLPPLATSPGLTHALMSGGSIVPLIDLPALLAGSAPSAPLPEAYSPALRRLELGRRPLPVVEFGLLGIRQALPREQTEEVVTLPPIRPIPGASALVAGVAEHQGELWPVLDLALYFGRTTTVGPDTRGILIRDRNFRALVLADRLFGERLVPAERHRDLPLDIPHHLVFGCYLEEASVVLVLNVPALAVRFDPSLVPLFQGSVPAPPEIASEPSAIAGQPAPPPPAPLAPPSSEPHRQDPGERQVSAASGREENDREAVTEGTGADWCASPESHPLVPLPEQESVASPVELSSEPGDLPSLSGQEPEVAPCPPLLLTMEERPLLANPRPDPPQGGAEAALEILLEAEESEQESQPDDEPPPLDAPLPPAEVVETVAEEFATTLPEPEGAAECAAAREKTAEEVEAAAPREKEASSATRAEQAAIVPATPASRDPSAMPLSNIEEAAVPAVPLVHARASAPLPKSRRFRRSGAMTLATLLALTLAGLLWLEQAPQERDRSLAVAAPSFTPEPVSLPLPPPQTPLSPLPAEAPRAAASRPAEPVAALPTPASGPYIVRRGDTLWDIAASFTGNPFNFPRIARENEIRNPDRIYPGQQIAVGPAQGQ